MKPSKLPSAAACQFTATATATRLVDLLMTAHIAGGGTALEMQKVLNSKNGINHVHLNPSDGDIRLLYDGNTPTGDIGIKVFEANSLNIPDVPIGNIIVIRDTAATSDVLVNNQIGQSGQNAL